MRISGRLFVELLAVVLVIAGGLFVWRSADQKSQMDGEGNQLSTEVSSGTEGLEQVRQRFSDTVSELHHLDEEHRAELLSLYWDLYVLAARGKHDEFLAKWVNESILVSGSRCEADEPLDQMSRRFEGIRKRFAEHLESIGVPLTPEMKATAGERTQCAFLAAEEVIIDFLNHLKHIKVEKRIYERMYQSKPESSIGDDCIKGVSSALFGPDPRTDEIIIGVALIASLRNKSEEEIKNYAGRWLKAHLKTSGMISTDAPDSLILTMPDRDGRALGCVIVGFLADYKDDEINRLDRQIPQESPSFGMPIREYVTVDKNAVFPHPIPSVDKGGIRNYPSSPD
ncbi:MAG TPA: hypothetical protein PLY86_19750 [bacterium]|nr:hypothetical protein [bacterium]